MATIPVESALRDFTLTANDFLTSKYILADTKITALLKSIARSDDFCAIFEMCLTDYDFQRAKKECYVSSYYGDDSRKELQLPDKTNDLLAFCFLTLIDFDNGTIKLADYLQTYFYRDGSFYESYNVFLAEFINPFVSSFVGVVQSVIDGRSKNPVEELRESKVKDATECVLLKEVAKDAAAISQLKSLLNADKDSLLALEIDDKRRGEMLVIIDEFYSCLDERNTKMLKFAYLAYKFMAVANRKFNFNLFKITTLIEKEKML